MRIKNKREYLPAKIDVEINNYITSWTFLIYKVIVDRESLSPPDHNRNYSLVTLVIIGREAVVAMTTFERYQQWRRITIYGQVQSIC